MINATNIFKFLHVLSAIVWVGGGFMLQMLLARARSARSGVDRGVQPAAEWTSQHVFMPASFAALVFGIAHGDRRADTTGATRGSRSASSGFVDLRDQRHGAILGPTAKKMKAVIEERGPNDPVATHMARRLDLFGTVDLIVLIAVVFDMVVKPGL